MAVLDQVMQLKGQGMGDDDIVNNLQQQGVSPKEITDAINQAQIKNAVTGGPGDAPAQAPAAPTAGGEEFYTPQTQEAPADYAAPQGEYYEEGAYAPAQGGLNSDTMIELANQVFAEKMKKPEKLLSELNEFKELSKVKLDHMEDRLKRIEKIIDTLQIKILEKVGSYGSDLRKTKKEVAMIEETIGKIAKKSKTSKAK